MIEPILFLTQRTQAPANRNARSKQPIMVANASAWVACDACVALRAFEWKSGRSLCTSSLVCRAAMSLLIVSEAVCHQAGANIHDVIAVASLSRYTPLSINSPPRHTPINL